MVWASNGVKVASARLVLPPKDTRQACNRALCGAIRQYVFVPRGGEKNV